MVTQTTAESARTIVRRRFTVDDYHKMGEAGILTENDREAWLSDLPKETVYRFTRPTTGGYRFIERFARGDRIESAVLPALTISIDIDDLFA